MPAELITNLRHTTLVLFAAVLLLMGKALHAEDSGSVVPREAKRLLISLPEQKNLEMAFIPSGAFIMGSHSIETNRDADEYPHRVNITKPFWMGIYEITQEQYQAVMGTNPSFFQNGGDYPVENISWFEAKEFCDKLNRNQDIPRPAGYHFDLPTEAQWEYACRAGTTTAYHWGNSLNGDKANCDGNYPYGSTTTGTYRKQTTPVGHFQNPNPWGLHDMHGNVWEWTRDHALWQNAAILTGNYNSDQIDPVCTHGDERIYRGGGWANCARTCRAAYRRSRAPENRFFNIGMRLALVPDEDAPKPATGRE